jgi:hypothetical protein
MSEPMELDMPDGEEHRTVSPMGSQLADLNSEDHSFEPLGLQGKWCFRSDSRFSDHFDLQHISAHFASPSRYSSPTADLFGDTSATDDLYFTIAEADSAENSQQPIPAPLNLDSVNNSPDSSRSSTPGDSRQLQLPPAATHSRVLDGPPVMLPETIIQPSLGNLDPPIDLLIIPSLPARNPPL